MDGYMNTYAAERMLSLATDADFRDVPLEYALKAYKGELNDQHLIDTVLVPSFVRMCSMMESQLAALPEADALALLSEVSDLTEYGYRDNDDFTDKYAGTGFGIMVELRFQMKELTGIGVDIDKLRGSFLTYDNSVTLSNEYETILYDLLPIRGTLGPIENHNFWTKIRKSQAETMLQEQILQEQILDCAEHLAGAIYSSHSVEDKPTNLSNTAVYSWEELYEAERKLGHHAPQFDTVWFAFMDILNWFIKTVDEASAAKNHSGVIIS